MARAQRQLEPGMIQHLMWHGNRHDVVFVDEADYKFFLSLLWVFTAYYGVKLYGYCLMTNHIHMLAEPRKDNLPNFMQRVGHAHATRFNSKHDLWGHSFSGRYRPVAVTTDEHFMLVSRYIHLNPVAAGLAEHPADYPWSSCQEYLGLRHSQFVCVDRVLGDYFQGPHNDLSEAARSYASFLYENFEGDGLPAMSKVGGIWIYEDKAASEHKGASAGQTGSPEKRPLERCEGSSIELVDRIVAENWQATHKLPAGGGHGPTDQRDAALYLIRALSGATYPEIAKGLSIEPATARIAVSRFKRKLARRPWLREQVEELAASVRAACGSINAALD